MAGVRRGFTTLPAWSAGDISFDVPFRARVSFNGSDIDNPGGGVFVRWEGGGAAPVPEPASMCLIGGETPQDDDGSAAVGDVELDAVGQHRRSAHRMGVPDGQRITAGPQRAETVRERVGVERRVSG